MHNSLFAWQEALLLPSVRPLRKIVAFSPDCFVGKEGRKEWEKEEEEEEEREWERQQQQPVTRPWEGRRQRRRRRGLRRRLLGGRSKDEQLLLPFHCFTSNIPILTCSFQDFSFSFPFWMVLLNSARLIRPFPSWSHALNILSACSLPTSFII